MTDLENAALSYVRARAARDESKKALRASWHLDPFSRDECQRTEPVWIDGGDGGAGQFAKSSPCHRRKDRESLAWCEVCTRRQALYLAHQFATRRMCGAWLHLRAVARNIEGDK